MSMPELRPRKEPKPDNQPVHTVVPDEEDVIYQPVKKRGFFRVEWILGLIALLSAAALVGMLVLCLPYMGPRDEDPQSISRHDQAEEDIPPEDLEEDATQPQEEASEPTIPPESNPYTVKDFQYDRNNYLRCLRQTSYAGVDVSAFQGDIDWPKVKASGIDFAIIRLGYRGYGMAGRMVEDEFAQDNLKEATEVGLPIGAYFFSQALSIAEADEEIEFMLQILGEYQLDLPIILDWEIPGAENPRTKNMDLETLTAIQLHFCKVMTEKGYDPMIYFNWHQSRTLLRLSDLEDYPFWLALYQDRMTYPWHVEMWQYTDRGRVPGIEGNVDLNVYMPS